MATVIDSLILELGLDPKGFTKGQKEAAASIAKTRETAQKHGAGIEKSMDGAAEAVDRLARNALKLFALFTAGRAVKDFVADITSADAALGRLAKSVGSTPEVISSLGNAVSRNGGSASAAAGSFERLADSINEIKTTGNSSILPYLYRLQGLGGKQINLNKEMSETFADLAENAKNIADQKSIPFATYLLKQAGVDRDTAALMVQGREAYNKALAESRKIGIVRKEDVQAAQKLQTTMESLRQTSEGFGRTVMTALTPTINDLLERMQRWITANQDWLKTEIVEKVGQLATWLKSIDWDGVGRGIKAFVEGCGNAVSAVGGWIHAVELLFALWVGAGFIKAMAQIALMRAALIGGGGSLLAALSRVAAPVAIGAVALGHGFQTPEEYNKKLETDPEAKKFDDDRRAQRDSVRTWWGRTMPTWLGGSAKADEGGGGIRARARRSVGATDEGRLNARAPEGAGKYRPEYKVGEADLSQRTADIIAGEAIRKNPESIDAVINNMMNRVGSKGWGPSKNLLEVATAPGQYEAAWRGSKASPSETKFIQERIQAIASGGVPDNTKGSNAYRASGYRGPWYQKHADAPVVGGNRYAYEPGAANGPYAPYATPKDVAGPSATLTSTPRRPEVLADPRDERRQPAQAAPAPEAGKIAPKPVASAWTGYPQAAAFVSQARDAQAAVASSTTNDNRSTSSAETNINGPINIHTAAQDASGIARDIGPAMKRHAFAAAANYARA